VSRTLRVLLVESIEADAERILHALFEAGYAVEMTRVRQVSELDAEVSDGRGWEVAISALELDGSSGGLEAHDMLSRALPRTPFILVARSISPSQARDVIAAGIVDCVFKDRLAFLGGVVERALRQERMRVQREIAEQALRFEEARYESLFREAPVALFRLDLSEVRAWLNASELTTPRELRDLLEGSSEALLATARLGRVIEGNEKARELVEPFAQVQGTFEPYLEAGLGGFWVNLLEGWMSTEPLRIAGEFDVQKGEGKVLRLLLSASFLGGDENEWSDVIVAALDITAQSELQAQMEDVQRMESVGRLAGGVAHDFNNALTVIQTYATFVGEALEEGDPIREDVAVILQSARSAAGLTERLLAFGRRQVQQLEPVSLNQSVDGIIGILRRIIGEDIEVVANPARDLWLTEADRTQVQQLLMNLAVNARDAMTSGGTLTFSTRNVRVLRASPDRLDVAPGEYVRLDVSDTGVGMDPSTAAQVFDPFFTTKPAGQGTGLGLSTVYGIVKQCGGHIWVRSSPGQGTTFEILLPHAGECVVGEDRPVTVTRSDLGGSERLLLVEDDEALRVATRRILQHRGYEVIEAGSAEEGLRQWTDTEEAFDGVVTDVILPGMDGLEMSQALRELRDDLPVLFMSGYSYEQYAGVTELPGAVGFIRKPFTVDEMLTALRSTLDSAGASSRL